MVSIGPFFIFCASVPLCLYEARGKVKTLFKVLRTSCESVSPCCSAATFKASTFSLHMRTVNVAVWILFNLGIYFLSPVLLLVLLQDYLTILKASTHQMLTSHGDRVGWTYLKDVPVGILSLLVLFI